MLLQLTMEQDCLLNRTIAYFLRTTFQTKPKLYHQKEGRCDQEGNPIAKYLLKLHMRPLGCRSDFLLCKHLLSASSASGITRSTAARRETGADIFARAFWMRADSRCSSSSALEHCEQCSRCETELRISRAQVHRPCTTASFDGIQSSFSCRSTLRDWQDPFFLFCQQHSQL